MTKNGKRTLIIAFITLMLLGLYNAMLFVFCKHLNETFWISYAFFTFAVVMFVLSLWISSAGTFAGKIMEISIATLAYMHLALEFIISTIFIAFACFSIPFAAVFFPQLFILVLMLIIYIPVLINGPNVGAGRKEKVNGVREYSYQKREREDAETDAKPAAKEESPKQDEVK